MLKEVSFNEIARRLTQALNQGLPDNVPGYWIRDVFPDRVVYQDSATDSLFARDYSWADDGSVVLTDPEPVTETTTYRPLTRVTSAAMSGTPAVVSFAGQMVTREGKVFEVGDFPDKHFGLTEAEADAAIASFAPVDLELEHFATEGRPSIFDGRLGSLTRIWRDGANIMGAVDLPAWADEAWAPHGRKISTVWHNATKNVLRAGLVLNPRVTDAALMGSFAAFAGARHSEKDKADMQLIHDLAAGQGATCADTTKETKMSEEVKAPAPDTAVEDRVAAMAAEIAVLRAQNDANATRFAQAAAAARHKEAVAFATRAVEQGRVLPHLHGRVTALYEAALADDEAHGTEITFSDTTETIQKTNRATLVQGLFEGLRPHGLTTEQIAGATAMAAQVTPAPAKTEAETDAELLAETELGRAAARRLKTEKEG